MTKGQYEWMVRGDCVEGCTSPPVCPGYWNSPMHAQFHNGHSQCEGVWTFNIIEGYYGDTDLSGFLVSYAFDSPSPFPPKEKTPWISIIYIDKAARAPQADALEKVFRTCWKTMGDVIGVKRAGIEFKKELVEGGPAARHRVRIEGIYNFSARPFRTIDKRPRYVNSYQGGHIYIGISEENEFHDADLPRGNWNAPGMSNTYHEFIMNSDKHVWLP